MTISDDCWCYARPPPQGVCARGPNFELMATQVQSNEQNMMTRSTGATDASADAGPASVPAWGVQSARRVPNKQFSPTSAAGLPLTQQVRYILNKRSRDITDADRSVSMWCYDSSDFRIHNLQPGPTNQEKARTSSEIGQNRISRYF